MPKPLTLLNRFDRLNRRHFKGRLKRPSMVRFSKKLDTSDPLLLGHTEMKGDGRVYIVIHEALKPFPALSEFILVHEMVHQWNDQRGIKSVDDNCRKRDGKHHKKMLSILKREPWLC